MEPVEIEKAPEQFSIAKRAKSFTHAFRGIWIMLARTHNAWIHSSILALVVIAGAYFRITPLGWVLIILCAGLVFTAEAFNTAIEVDIDLTSPDYHPFARDTKDIAAGAVLIACITAVAVGVFIFLPSILTLLQK